MHPGLIFLILAAVLLVGSWLFLVGCLFFLGREGGPAAGLGTGRDSRPAEEQDQDLALECGPYLEDEEEDYRRKLLACKIIASVQENSPDPDPSK